MLRVYLDSKVNVCFHKRTSMYICIYTRDAYSHARIEDVFFILHMLSVVSRLERRGREFACLAEDQLAAQLDTAELLKPPPQSPACHFGIVSVVQSLFNLSLSLFSG